MGKLGNRDIEEAMKRDGVDPRAKPKTCEGCAWYAKSFSADKPPFCRKGRTEFPHGCRDYLP